jgi:hypothetical protein
MERGRIISTSKLGKIIWVLNFPDTEWYLKCSWQSSFRFDMAVGVQGSVVVVDRTSLMVPDGDYINGLVNFEGIPREINRIFASKNAIAVLFYADEFALLPVEWTDKDKMRVKSEKRFRLMFPFPDEKPLREIKSGETYVCQVEVEDQPTLFEIDLDRERYRSVKIDKNKKGTERLFIHQEDFYSSTDYEQGPVVKGKTLEEAPWKAFEPVESKGTMEIMP